MHLVLSFDSLAPGTTDQPWLSPCLGFCKQEAGSMSKYLLGTHYIQGTLDTGRLGTLMGTEVPPLHWQYYARKGGSYPLGHAHYSWVGCYLFSVTNCWGLEISGLFLLITTFHFWQCEKCGISLIPMSRRSLLSLQVFKFDIGGPRISGQALNSCGIYEYKNEQFPHFSLQRYCPWVPSIIIFSSPLPFSLLLWLLEIYLFSTNCLPFSSMEYILSNFFLAQMIFTL